MKNTNSKQRASVLEDTKKKRSASSRATQVVATTPGKTVAKKVTPIASQPAVSSGKGTSVRKSPVRKPRVVVTSSPSSGEIARRAYELYVARGGHHGHDLEDWLEAEQQLSRAHG